MPPNLPRAALPQRPHFDPWNSSSTGHQRAENRLAGSTSWRDSRTAKLRAQFRDTSSTGGPRAPDTVVVVGSADARSSTHAAAAAREKGQAGIKEAFGRSSNTGSMQIQKPDADAPTADKTDEGKGRGIFANLTFYINGSTYPTISDHKLKQLIGKHGGALAISLGRRTVTHVILGDACDGAKGAGGGLAGGKLQKEILSRKSLRLVSAEWVVECVRRGKRVSEVGYGRGVAMKGQGSVLGAVAKR